MNHLNIDIETFSSVDISKSGMYRYAQSPDFDILLFAYSLDGGPVKVLDLAIGEIIPTPVKDLLFGNGCIKRAYNAAFEWYCLSRYFNLSGAEALGWLRQWRCTMLHAQYCGYPAGLAATGKALGLPADKQKLSAGMALIRTFCNPAAPTRANGQRTRILPHHEPDKWRLFKHYNAQDVTAEMEIERRLSAFPVPDEIQKQWEIDQAINMRGVAVDLELIEGALACSETVTAELTAEAVSLSGLSNPNSVKQLQKWIAEETGEDIGDMKKDTVKGLLGGDLESDKARRMLEIRQEMSKTSVKKYTAMAETVCGDGRIRGTLRFYGANRTGRWAGQFLQPQNLPQTHIEPLDLARELVKGKRLDSLRCIYGSVPSVLSELIRTAIVPDPGHVFVDADFSAIEARVIAWLAGEEWVLDVFRTHGKIYEACAAQMFGVDIDLIVKGRPEYALRQKGKVATLALGYQGGVSALINLGALKMGIPEEELPDIVARWRLANTQIKNLWYTVENAALETVRTGRATTVKHLTFAMESDIDGGQAFFVVTLPSGRKLYYARPFITANQWGKDSLRYYGMNQTTKKWEAVDTYGGKLTENIVQATARDCLAAAIERLEAAGYPVVFHVHDEVVCEIPETQKAHCVEIVSNFLSLPIPWAPGLPLAAAGWAGEFYTKE